MDRLDPDKLKAAREALLAMQGDSTPENLDVSSSTESAHGSLKDAIAAAQDNETPDLETQVTALAQETGTEPLTPQGREVIKGIRGKLSRIANIMQRVPPEEREAIQAAVLDPEADIEVPDTPSAREIKQILVALDEAANSADLPPHMRRHSKAMALRPVGESIKVFAEGGILTLIGNGLLSAFGIVVTPYSVAHALTYATATFGVGLVNMTTISDRVLRPAAEGSLKPLVQNANKRRGISLLHTGSSGLRLALLSVSVVAGIGMAQDTIRKTHDSSRIAGGITSPLDAFAKKKATFEKQLAAFPKIPAMILEIAGKIEEGKPSGTAVQTTETPSASEVSPSVDVEKNPKMIAARAALSKAESRLKDASTKKQRAARSEAVADAKATIATLEKELTSKQVPTKAPTETRSAVGAYVAWSQAEKQQMLNELRTAFVEAGINPEEASSIRFTEPTKLGYGTAAKLKRAIRTGDTSDLPSLQSYSGEAIQKLTSLVGHKTTTAEYVTAIRAKMGLSDTMTIDEKMTQIVRNFFALPVFATVNTNWESAQRFSGLIKRQGDDVLATAERAFLHGAEPIGPETVIPYASAIISARAEVDKAAQDNLLAQVKEVFGTMQSALTIAGAPVTLVTPEVHFDTSDIQSLQDYLATLISNKAKRMVTMDGTQTAINAMVDKFIPGGTKWDKTKQWLAVYLLQSHGYYVRLEGDKMHIYESATTPIAEKAGPEPSIINTVSKYYGEWMNYLHGKGPAEEWRVPRPEIEKDTNQSLGAKVRPQLEDLAEQRKRLIVTESELPATPATDPRSLSDEEIGKMVKEQVETQHALGQKPIIVSPEIWEAMKKGVPPTTVDAKVDMSAWHELDEAATQRVMTEYESAAAWRGITYLGGGVGTLILGIMLLSLAPVYRLNKKLRAAAPDFEKDLDVAEKTIAEALDALNDSLAGIPVLSSLPRMDFTMMHAALRMAAEESHPAEISEHPSAGRKIMHTVKEAFSRGPYAYRVEEIMSYTDLIEKLQNNKSMQRRLIDIIAPGATRAEKKVSRLPPLPLATGTITEDMRAQIAEMSTATGEIFRNAARGNLGFRISVLNAQQATLTSLSACEAIEWRKIAISDEQGRVQTQLDELEPILKRLNSDDLFARMTITHKTPWSFSRRASAQDRAGNPPSIVIPADGMTNRRYSVPRGIIDDVRARIDSLAPADAEA